ncbi:MAG: hypothetical protein ABR974_14410 [Bacteroidales bacterium]|jgi:hypothetical protein
MVKFKITFFLFMISMCVESQVSTYSLLSPGSNRVLEMIGLQKKYLARLYNSGIVVHNELINGTEYAPYYSLSAVSPLLFPLKKRTATVDLGNRQYSNVSLQYDTYLDEIICTDYSRFIGNHYPQIALTREKIKGFTLFFDDDTMNFRYLRFPGNPESGLKDGFYEVAYKGKSQYIIKHVSKTYNKEGIDQYAYYPENYINTGNEFSKVRNKKKFLALFGVHLGEISTYLSERGIRIKKITKYQLKGLLKYYDSLKPVENLNN